jgi:hypothetical protein
VASEVRLLVPVKESDRALGLLGLLLVPLDLPLGLLLVPLDLPLGLLLVPLGLPLGLLQALLVRESDRAPLPLQRPPGPPVGESDQLPHVD